MKNSKIIFVFIIAFIVFFNETILADIPSPERERRQKEVDIWNGEFPGLKPSFQIQLDESKKEVYVQMTFYSPADYVMYFDEIKIQKSIKSLRGGVVSETFPITIKKGADSFYKVRCFYTLYGVKNTRFGPKLTDSSINGCVIKRYAIRFDNDTVILKEDPEPGIYLLTRECNL